MRKRFGLMEWGAVATIVACVVGVLTFLGLQLDDGAPPPTTTTTANPTSTAIVETTRAEPAQEPTEEAALADSSQTFVSDIENFDVGNGASINGKTFADAFTYTYVDCDTWCGNASVDLNLARRYRLLTARVGVLDNSKGNGNITVRLVGDGRTLLTKTVSLGKSYDVRLSVRNILRLRILATAPDGAPGGTVAIGDPTVST